MISEANKASIYLSYYSDNKNVTNTAIKIANWLREQNIDVIFDKFFVITNGLRKWRELSLSSAKRIILIISPGYLKICKLDESDEKDKKLDAIKDQLAYNEICHVRDEITKNPSVTDKFIVILVETSPDDLPFWMKRLNIYKYKNGQVDEKMLEVLKRE